MAKRNPQKLRNRVRADIRSMKSHKFCNNRAINYNLFRSYSIPITEMKQVFDVANFGDIVSACMEPVPDALLFGSEEIQRNFAQETGSEDPETECCQQDERGMRSLLQTDPVLPQGGSPSRLATEQVGLQDEQVVEPREEAAEMRHGQEREGEESTHGTTGNKKESVKNNEQNSCRGNEKVGPPTSDDDVGMESTVEITRNKSTRQWELQRKKVHRKRSTMGKDLRFQDSQSEQTEHTGGNGGRNGTKNGKEQATCGESAVEAEMQDKENAMESAPKGPQSGYGENENENEQKLNSNGFQGQAVPKPETHTGQNADSNAQNSPDASDPSQDWHWKCQQDQQGTHIHPNQSDHAFNQRKSFLPPSIGKSKPHMQKVGKWEKGKTTFTAGRTTANGMPKTSPSNSEMQQSKGHNKGKSIAGAEKPQPSQRRVSRSNGPHEETVHKQLLDQNRGKQKGKGRRTGEHTC